MSAPSLSMRSSGVQSDLDNLLIRMRQRLYPETIPVLVSYWLKTVYSAGHDRAWWKDLHGLLQQVLREQFPDGPSHDALAEMQEWIEHGGVVTGKGPATAIRRMEPFRANLRPERLAPYLGQLLNRWLSAEVAAMLVNETEPEIPSDDGIPVLAIGRALERLLVRERLSPGTLEMLLEPGLLSPRYVYPADSEMLRDVVLALLGRTEAPAPPVMPAILLCVAPGAALPQDYEEAVAHASYVETMGSEEIHVAIAASEGLDILKGNTVRIASLIATMDGRWWEPESLRSGETYTVVYRPAGRLRIDYSADHARLDVPWPAAEREWRGAVDFQESFAIFGREWRATSWEFDGERTWLHLMFSRVLPVAELQPVAGARSRSAAIDMAWAALETALEAAIAEGSREPVEQLRRPEFIPLGRAIFELAEAVQRSRFLKREPVDTQIRAIRYLQSEVSLVYGRVPWRILPAAVRSSFLKRRRETALVELLNQVFDAMPDDLTGPVGVHPHSPPQAA